MVLLASLVGIVMYATLHEGEHWRHMWLFYGLVWGVNVFCLGVVPGQKRTRQPPVVRQRQMAPER